MCCCLWHTGKLRDTFDVAIKILIPGQLEADDYLREGKYMNTLRHPKLVQLLAVCTKTEPIWLITELMTNGALLHYLQKDEGKTLTFISLADMARQVETVGIFF